MYKREGFNMPDLETHCRLSRHRIGKEFRGMHKWMDISHIELGADHRRERHDSSYIPFIERKWGKLAILEFLYHIEIDNKSTREKLEARFVKDKRLHIMNCKFCMRSVKKKFSNCSTCDVKLRRIKREFLGTYKGAIGESKFNANKRAIEDYAMVYAEEKLKESFRNKAKGETLKRIYYNKR